MDVTSIESEGEILSKFNNIFHQFKDFTTHYYKLQVIWYFRLFVKCSTILLLLFMGFCHYKNRLFDYSAYIGLHAAILIVCTSNVTRQLMTDRRLKSCFKDIKHVFGNMTEELSKWCHANNPNFAKNIEVLLDEMKNDTKIDLKSNDLISLVLFEAILWFDNIICLLINVFQQRQLHINVFVFCIISLVIYGMEKLLSAINNKSFKINDNMSHGIKNMRKIIDKCNEIQNNIDNCYGKNEQEMIDVTNENSGLIESEHITMAESSTETEGEILSKFSKVFHQFKDFTTHYRKLQVIWFFRFFVKCSTISLLLLLGFCHYKSGFFDYNTYVGLHLAVLIVCILNSARQLMTDRRFGNRFQDISDGFEGMTQVLSKWCDTNNPNFAKFVDLFLNEFNNNSNIDLKSNDLISLILLEVILWFANTICFVINVSEQRQLHVSILVFCIVTLVTVAMEILLNVITFKSFKINEKMNDNIKNMRNVIDGKTEPEIDMTNEDRGFIGMSSLLENDDDPQSSANENLSIPDDENKDPMTSTDVAYKLSVPKIEVHDTEKNESLKEVVEDSSTLESFHGNDRDEDPSTFQEQKKKKTDEDHGSQSSKNLFMPEDDDMTSTTVSDEFTVPKVEMYDTQDHKSPKEGVEDRSTLESFLGNNRDNSPSTFQEQEEIETDEDHESHSSKNLTMSENDDMTSTAVSDELTVPKIEVHDTQENKSLKEGVEDRSTLDSSHGNDRDENPSTFQEQQEENAVSNPNDINKNSTTVISVSAKDTVSEVEAFDIQQNESVKKEVKDIGTLESFHGKNKDEDPSTFLEQEEKKTGEDRGSQSSKNVSMPEDDKKDFMISSAAEKVSEKHGNTSAESQDWTIHRPFIQRKYVKNKHPDSDTYDDSDGELSYILKTRNCSHTDQRKDPDHRRIDKESSEGKIEITYGKFAFHMDLSPESEVDLTLKLSGKSMKMKTSTVAADAKHEPPKEE